MIRRGSPTRAYWAKPGFARREPNRALEFKAVRRRGLTGEPWVPPCLMTHSRELAAAICVVSPQDA